MNFPQMWKFKQSADDCCVLLATAEKIKVKMSEDIEDLRRRVNDLRTCNIQLEDEIKWLQDEVQ